MSEFRLIFILLLAVNSVKVKSMFSSTKSIEKHTFEDFPSDRIALHFPCKESNMFATNCACHVKCTELTCQNAMDLCKKYRDSVGCKYVLIRGGKTKKIATLKRQSSRICHAWGACVTSHAVWHVEEATNILYLLSFPQKM